MFTSIVSITRLQYRHPSYNYKYEKFAPIIFQMNVHAILCSLLIKLFSANIFLYDRHIVAVRVCFVY